MAKHIIAIAKTKGGVGGTMTACNLAVEFARRGMSVHINDGDDDNKSASSFLSMRKCSGVVDPTGDMITLTQNVGMAIRSEVPKMARHADICILDSPGKDGPSLRAALLIATTLLVPFPPRVFDAWAIAKLKGVISDAIAMNPHNPRILSYMPLAKPRGRQDNADTEALLREDTLMTYTGVMIRNRSSWEAAASQGLSVAELRPRDNEAVEELEALINAIL
jgi:chromosome partitioning protein